MKHRSVLAVVIFSIITLGIYDLFWLVSTKKELNARTRVHVPSLWLLIAPIAVLVLVGFLQLISHAASTEGNTGINIISILLGIVGVLGSLILPFYWLFKYSKAVNEYTSGEISTAVSFILLWILRFIGMAIIQDKFNEMITSGVAGSQATASVPAQNFATQGSNQQIQETPAPADPSDQPLPPTPPSQPVQ